MGEERIRGTIVIKDARDGFYNLQFRREARGIGRGKGKRKGKRKRWEEGASVEQWAPRNLSSLHTFFGFNKRGKRCGEEKREN